MNKTAWRAGGVESGKKSNGSGNGGEMAIE